MKYLKIILPVVLVGVICWWLIPSQRYVPKALINLHPGIEDYSLFYNRIVRAEDPHPWKIDSHYHTSPVPDALQKSVDDLGTVAFVVIRDSALLFERYWDNYGETSYSNSFSMAKSVVSLLVGAAMNDGLITSLDMPVTPYLPMLKSETYDSPTLRDLLTMSAGIDWNEAYNGLFAPNTRAYYGTDLPAQMDQVRLITAPGKKVYYQSGTTQLIAMFLEKITGMTISEYASQKIWTPIRAEQNALWSLDHKNGQEKAYCCFNSNARDFARLGQLVLNGGKWEGRRLVDSLYLSQATRPADDLVSQYEEQPNRVYGYQFWNLEYKGMQIPYLRGILGQYVFIIPQYNAVVVRLGHSRSKERTPQHYTADVDLWLDVAMQILQNN